jgi:hypothetical protein
MEDKTQRHIRLISRIFINFEVYVLQEKNEMAMAA